MSSGRMKADVITEVSVARVGTHHLPSTWIVQMRETMGCGVMW